MSVCVCVFFFIASFVGLKKQLKHLNQNDDLWSKLVLIFNIDTFSAYLNTVWNPIYIYIYI